MQQDDERLITTSMREQEDETEVTLRPRTLAEYYGQTQVKEMLSVFIQAAVKRHEPLDHLLLSCSMARRAWARPRWRA